MIGPGWLPSRPRPLGRVRRGPLPYTARGRRRRTALRPAAHLASGSGAPGSHPGDLLFDGVPAELPTAVLLPGAALARHRVLGGLLRRWLGDRWAWLRPRTVPILVAFIGMLAVLGSTTYLSSFALEPPRAARMAPGGPHVSRSHPCCHPLASPVIHLAPAPPAHHEAAGALAP